MPEPLHEHALEHLRYIRDTMERASAFTAVPGWGGVLMGATALAAAPLAGPPRESARWVAVWIVDALAVSLLLGAFCARFRDIPPIVASVMQIAFFVTPIIWKPVLVGANARFLPLNPFYSMLEIVRAPLLGSEASTLIWAAAIGYSVLLCGLAWLLFLRVRGRLAVPGRLPLRFGDDLQHDQRPDGQR